MREKTGVSEGENLKLRYFTLVEFFLDQTCSSKAVVVTFGITYIKV